MLTPERPPVAARREELRQRFGDKLIDTQKVETPLSAEEQRARNEIIDAKPQKVLVVCAAGVFRSGLVRNVLEQRGYSATNLGTQGAHPFERNDLAGVEFDAILYVTEQIQREFETRAQSFKLLERVQGVPTRVLNLPESSLLHTKEISATEKYQTFVEKKLDRLGFLEKE